MTISRRKFLRRSSVVSLAALFPLNATARARGAAPIDKGHHERLGRLTSDSFAGNLNTTFQIQVSALDVQELQLVEVKQTRFRGGRAIDVVFLGNKDRSFEQGTYMIQHGRMGTFPLFVVPIGNGKKGARYQAVLTRLSRPAGR